MQYGSNGCTANWEATRGGAQLHQHRDRFRHRGPAGGVRRAEVPGDTIVTPSGRLRTHQGRALAALALACAPLLTVVACTGSDKPDAAPSSSKPSATASASRNLDAAAKAARDLVDQYTPAGYPTSAVASGYDWANEHNQEITEILPGKHLFQIACSGPGSVSVKLSGVAAERQVSCGTKSVGVPFSGKIDAVVSGNASNSGTYAWRILRESQKP